MTSKVDEHLVVSSHIPAVDVAAIDELATMFQVKRSAIIRRAITKGLLKLVEADPDLAARYREARAKAQCMKRKELRYDPSILEPVHEAA